MDGFRSNLNTLHRYMDYTCAIMNFGRHLSEFTKWPYFSTGINLYIGPGEEDEMRLILPSLV